MEKRTAVVVDHDAHVGDLIAQVLTRSGFDVTVVGTGADGLRAVRDSAPDLVATDITLPDMDGIEVCRQVRAITRCYVVVISAQDSEVDRLMSLEVGADDFLSKPFSPRELQARVGALFRRPRTWAGESEPTRTQPVRAVSPVSIPAPRTAGIEVDRDARVVRVGDAVVDLTRTEFDLLAHLAQRPGVVISRDELMREVWESAYVPENTHIVDVHLANVRRKLRSSGGDGCIRTVRGVGLRFDPV